MSYRGPHNPRCWLALHGRFENGKMPPCDGRLVKVHLLKWEVIKRELPASVARELHWDTRVWVWGCGGPTGVGGHHGALDYSRRLRIPRKAIPRGLEELAKKHGLQWWLDLTYQRRALPGAHRSGRRSRVADPDR